jgi:hypothetical protein
VSRVIFPEQNRDQNQRGHRKCNQQARFPGPGRIGEQAESRASILGVGEAKEAGDNLDVTIEWDALRHDVLCPAVKHNHDESNQ